MGSPLAPVLEKWYITSKVEILNGDNLMNCTPMPNRNKIIEENLKMKKVYFHTELQRYNCTDL